MKFIGVKSAKRDVFKISFTLIKRNVKCYRLFDERGQRGINFFEGLKL